MRAFGLGLFGMGWLSGLYYLVFCQLQFILNGQEY